MNYNINYLKEAVNHKCLRERIHESKWVLLKCNDASQKTPQETGPRETGHELWKGLCGG